MSLLKYCLMIFCCATLLTACSGGSGSDSSAEQTGQVTILLGDAPIHGWDEAWMTIREIRFLTRGGRDMIVLDEPVTVNLLELQHFTEMLISREVLTGTIHRIRFLIDDLTLHKFNSAGDLIEVQSPSMPRFGRIDVWIPGGVEIRAGERLVLELEMDLRHSVARDRFDPRRMRFRPVIRAKAVTEAYDGRLIRVEGIVDGLTDQGDTRVCDIRRADGRRRFFQANPCVVVKSSRETTFFDVDAVEGEGITVATSDHVVIYGKVDPSATEDTLFADVIAVGQGSQRLKGIARSSVANGRFALDVGHEDEPSEKTVELEVGAVGFDSVPKKVDPNVIITTNEVEAEGFMMDPVDPGDPDFKSFVVLLGHEVEVVGDEDVPTIPGDDQVVSGVVDFVSFGGDQIGVDGVCVLITAETDTVTIDTSGEVVQVEPVGFSDIGDTVEALGSFDADGCLVATTIIIER